MQAAPPVRGSWAALLHTQSAAPHQRNPHCLRVPCCSACGRLPLELICPTLFALRSARIQHEDLHLQQQLQCRIVRSLYSRLLTCSLHVTLILPLPILLIDLVSQGVHESHLTLPALITPSHICLILHCGVACLSRLAGLVWINL